MSTRNIIIGALFLASLTLGGLLFWSLNTSIVSQANNQHSEKKSFRSFLPFGQRAKEEEKKSPELQTPKVAPPPERTRSFLSGEEGEFENQFLAVMIEESVAARPYYRGLDAARVVFEIPAEGGIPRFLAFFEKENLPDEIGPVRSARDYFVELAIPVVSAYVHAGGSPTALKMIRSSLLTNIDEGLNDPRFLRDKTLRAPHNLFVKGPKIRDLLEQSPLKKPLFSFSNELPSSAKKVENIFVNFSTQRHMVSWKYDAQKNCYQRNQKYENMFFCPQNIVIIETAIWRLEGDEKNRLGVRTIGEGKALLFRDGVAIEAKWSRDTNKTLRLLSEDGDEILLRRGQTFVQFIENPKKLSFGSEV